MTESCRTEASKETAFGRKALEAKINGMLKSHLREARDNLRWLYDNVPPYFFVTMKDDVRAIVDLAVRLLEVATQQKVTLTEREDKYIVARLDIPGSLYATLKTLQERAISYAELTHSYAPIPGADRALEILRFEFGRKPPDVALRAKETALPRGTMTRVARAMKRLYPDFDRKELNESLRLLWGNNEAYVRISPPERVARVLWLYQQGRLHDGLYFDMEGIKTEGPCDETRLLFSVVDPPEKGFMTQVSEVFQRLGVGVQRSYVLIITAGARLHFLGTFYVVPKDHAPLEKGSALFRTLEAELYNTQIVSSSGGTYQSFVAKRILTGEEASLVEAFAAFCHTTLAHSQPDRFAIEVVHQAFESDLDMTQRLSRLFRARFDPDLEDRQRVYGDLLAETIELIEAYQTGNKYLDDLRRTIFRVCVAFIRHVVKTNFFVPEKRALAFRLDPAYLGELDQEFVSDLPPGVPFRITFFLSRYGLGYHVGFSDIARGGWRTIICTNRDEYVTNTNTLFREVFVLAHTQHLKNKDIYEGGSKLVVVLDAVDCDTVHGLNQRLFKLQHGLINAFLDIFVTERGKARHTRVLDYYGEEEPIELGPDENMFDDMIERIARQSVKRGYVLGQGIMSSKRVGISHREYGVTARGVVKFAEIAMRTLGRDMAREPFSVKMTGGTAGDVAGNAIRLLSRRFALGKIVAVVDGGGGLYDREGAKAEELEKLFMKDDVVGFDPEALHPGGFILFRREHRREGLRTLHRKLIRRPSGVEEEWVTSDDLHRQLDELIFSVTADLFLPCGGRPETIDGSNWKRFFKPDGSPTAKVISEGANSFISPEARVEIEKRGVLVLCDVSANKCGVIASSYEIIANLLMTEREFIHSKDDYVKDVLAILDRRVEEEANLIFRRHASGEALCSEISRAISLEINDYYSRLFLLFRDRADLTKKREFRRALFSHLPALIRETPKFRARVKRLPTKIRDAILASEIASSIVYQGGWEMDLGSRLAAYVKERFL